MTERDTIYAPASGQGRAGIAVIRISGPAAHQALAALAGPLPEPRRAALRTLRRADGAALDTGLVLRFEAGASVTGEPVAEIHAHGGPAVVRAILEALGAQPGLRLAEPGEFTLRAFEAGRMDLAEVEALGDLLAAETEAQRAQAMRGIGGALRERAEGWRARLLRAAALVAVTIDWADDEAPEEIDPEAGRLLGAVAGEIGAELAVADGAARLRTGLEVAILGAPNAGKSTLLNALAGRPAALTSPEPGTTRDVVELRYDLEGLPVTFLDMAGLRSSEDPIEAAGVAMARARAEAADVRLLVAAPDAPLPPEAMALERPGDLRVAAKADLGAGEGLAVMAPTGAGLPELLAAIGDRLRARVGDGGGLVAHERQRRALEAARSAALRAAGGLDRHGPELVSEDIRAALTGLERLAGRSGVEDVLDEVFAAFCLGK